MLSVSSSSRTLTTLDHKTRVRLTLFVHEYLELYFLLFLGLYGVYEPAQPQVNLTQTHQWFYINNLPTNIFLHPNYF